MTEAVQQQILEESIQIFRADHRNGLYFWYDYADHGTATSTSENFYGLVRADGSKKPAYVSFVAAAAQK